MPLPGGWLKAAEQHTGPELTSFEGSLHNQQSCQTNGKMTSVVRFHDEFGHRGLTFSSVVQVSGVRMFTSIARPAHLPSEVARAIREQIATGGYAVGSKLPTEAELCRSFEVSRSVIREAMAQLRSAGLVASRQGSGVFVMQLEAVEAFRVDGALLLHARQLAPVFELRIELEKSAAELAAERRSRQQLAELRGALRQIEQCIRTGDWGSDPDYSFHMLICEAAGNRHLWRLLQHVTTQIIASVAARRRRDPPTPAVLDRVHREHEEILAALTDRRGAAASAAMEGHLLGAAERLGLSFGKETW